MKCGNNRIKLQQKHIKLLLLSSPSIKYWPWRLKTVTVTILHQGILMGSPDVDQALSIETEDSHSYNATHPCWLFSSHREYCQTAEACLLWGTQTDNFEQRSVKLKYWNKTRRKLLWTVPFCTILNEWRNGQTFVSNRFFSWQKHRLVRMMRNASVSGPPRGGGGLGWSDKRHGWEIFHLLVSSIAMSGARGRYYRNLETHGIT